MINENGLLNIFPTAEASGSIVSFENGADGIPMESLSVAVEPIQDLHGYSSPWSAGGGANQWDEEWERGTIGLRTGAKVDDNTKIRSKNYVPISPNTAYYYKFPGNWRMAYFDSDKNIVQQGNTYSPNIILKSPATAHYLLFALDATTEYDNNIAINYPSTVTTYSPYSNICPITGRTGLSVYVSSTQDQQDATTYAVDWTTEAGTVYDGTMDLVTGVLKARPYYPSYSGQALVGPWVSSMDAYAAGTTPTTGAQVVDMGGTETTYQLTAQEVATLLGENRVWSDAGDISLVYHTQVDATPSSIDGLFINGEGLQADGWFLKWRKLAAPKPKTDYVSVWGRDGDIDLTESETDGQVFYENRELTMDMVYMGEDWTDAYSELLDMLHGKECAVQFSNDPYWYWAGRIIASLYEHKPHSLAMSGIMFPYKLSVAKITKSATVSGAIESNGVEVVLPSSRMRVSPKVTVVAGTGESVTLKWGAKTQTLSAGTYYVRGLKVGSDDVTIKVWGTGTVTFEYRKGML